MKAEPLSAFIPASAPDATGNTLLRFITCGSVDDGKSTLIGRLLYECGAVFDDQLEALTRDSAKFGTNGAALDYALLVDGLAAEREQGITIDVAYRYFSSARRSFIVADTPGHEQYTRNMATGASTADLAILLVDARLGLLPQTRRHAFIVALAGVRHVILAVNKMDLVGYSQTVFAGIEAEFRKIAAGFGFASLHAVPVSARNGDNITVPSSAMPWYKGQALLPLLDTADTARRQDEARGFALPVQWVNRPNLDFRGFAGTLAQGRVKVGDSVTALPSGAQSRIARILTPAGDQPEAQAGDAITLTLNDEIDVSRGDVLVGAGADLTAQTSLTATLLATAPRALRAGDSYLLKLGTAQANARITLLHHAVDIETYQPQPADHLPMNGIGLASLRLDKPVIATAFAQNATLGGFILIDRVTHETVAFGFVEAGEEGRRRQAGETARRLNPFRAHLQAAKQSYLAAESRVNLTPALTWRLSSAGLLGGAIYMLTGQAGLAAALAAGDALARPMLRALHGAFWNKGGVDSLSAPLTIDGGGI
jgi:bifunctional enzyme CysN/CysC